ncbi:hypothetical protein V6N12_044622 [Hibiscus sabdariffa]|uniref:Uncharacterized protein n=1 Tax=Hibiscus sabdariffa TaxID=183260 RepID=A0ABR2AXY1_9ROSI
MITTVLFALSSNPTFPRNLWEIGSESSCTPATFENRNNLSNLPNVVFSSAIAAVPRCLTAFDIRPKRLPFHQVFYIALSKRHVFFDTRLLSSTFMFLDAKVLDGLFVVELHRDYMDKDGPHACDSIQGLVPGDLGFEFGLLCVGSVGEHLSEVPAGEL